MARRRRRPDHLGERRRGALPALPRSEDRSPRRRVPHHAGEERLDVQRDGHARRLPRPEIHRRGRQGRQAGHDVLVGPDSALLRLCRLGPVRTPLGLALHGGNRPASPGCRTACRPPCRRTPSAAQQRHRVRPQGVDIRQLRKTADFAVVYHATSSTDLLFHLVKTMKTRRAALGARRSASATRSSCQGRSTTGRPTSPARSSGAPSAAPSAPGTTGRSFRTTCRRSSGTTRCGRPTAPAASGPSQGRESLWPDNSTNGLSATTAWNLGKRTRVFGNLSFSKWSQNAALQPYTINTVLPVYPARAVDRRRFGET